MTKSKENINDEEEVKVDVLDGMKIKQTLDEQICLKVPFYFFSS